jgi:hypothetical protein
MDSKMAMVTAWSYGLAGVLAALLTLYLASGWRAGGRSRAMFLAVSLCALWGMLGPGLCAHRPGHLFSPAACLADMLRFGGWYLFLLVLMKPDAARGRNVRLAGFGWLGARRAAAVLVGFAAASLVVSSSVIRPGAVATRGPVRLAGDERLRPGARRAPVPERCRLTSAGASSRCAWGSGALFLFDLYLYSDALLFNRVDPDAFSIRGFAHALGLPLVALSAIRSHDWKRRDWSCRSARPCSRRRC